MTMHYGLFQNTITVTYKGNDIHERIESPSRIADHLFNVKPDLTLISKLSAELKEIMDFGIEDGNRFTYIQKFQYMIENYDKFQYLPFRKAMSLVDNIFMNMDVNYRKVLLERYDIQNYELMDVIVKMLVELTGYEMKTSTPCDNRWMLYSTDDAREFIRQVSFMFKNHEFKVIWQRPSGVHGVNYYSCGEEIEPPMGRFTPRNVDEPELPFITEIRSSLSELLKDMEKEKLIFMEPDSIHYLAPNDELLPYISKRLSINLEDLKNNSDKVVRTVLGLDKKKYGTIKSIGGIDVQRVVWNPPPKRYKGDVMIIGTKVISPIEEALKNIFKSQGDDKNE